MFKITTLAALLSVSTAFGALAQDFVPAGTTLEPGQAAIVPFLIPQGAEVPISVTVTEVEAGDIADLGGFELPPEYENATPYYARFDAENLSNEDLANYQVSGFVAVDSDGGEVMPSITLGGAEPFATCENPAPASFANGESHSGCVLLLLPEGTELTGVGYRGNYRYEEGTDTEQAFPIYYDPVIWAADAAKPTGKTKGTVVAPAT